MSAPTLDERHRRATLCPFLRGKGVDVPQAGFCSECQRYVWVQPNGRCPYGHAPENLRDIHEAASLPGFEHDAQSPQFAEMPGVELPAVPPASPPPPADSDPLPGYTQPQAAPLDTEPAMPVSQANGLPVGVSRFNWGAFLIPFFWPLVYGLPELALVYLLIYAPTAVLLAKSPDNPLVGLFAIGLLGAEVLMGFLGPRMYWKRFPTKLAVAEYNRKQRKWLVIGLALQVLPFLLLAFKG